MTLLSQQTFSQDLIVDKLVEYFNGLPTEQRTVGAHDFPVYKIKVSSNGTHAEPVFTCDDTPVSDESYIGEASFIWCGPRGYPVMSNRDSFYEISKYITPQAAGVALQFRSSETHVQWKNAQGEWENLFHLGELRGPEGPAGKSAYLEALDRGFVGTIDEWIESLKGKDAYSVALDRGYVGTFEEWARDMSTPIILESDAFKFLTNDGVNTFWSDLTVENMSIQEYIDHNTYEVVVNALNNLTDHFVTYDALDSNVERVVNNMTLDSGELP